MNKRILFIGGGNMAEGIIRGIINGKVMEPSQICVSEILKARCEYLKDTYKINICENLQESVKTANILLFAIRPQNAESALSQIKNIISEKHIIISIVAGLNIEKIKVYTNPESKIVRVMPNVLIEAKHGYSALCISDKVGEEEIKTVSSIFEAIGQTMVIDEKLFNEFTAFSCAGPAYVMYFINSMIDAGVEAGFSRNDARNIVLENMIGSGLMLQLTGKHPYQITDQMTSPAGVTIAGLHTLNSLGFNGIVMDAISDAVERSNKL